MFILFRLFSPRSIVRVSSLLFPPRSAFPLCICPLLSEAVVAVHNRLPEATIKIRHCHHQPPQLYINHHVSLCSFSIFGSIHSSLQCQYLILHVQNKHKQQMHGFVFCFFPLTIISNFNTSTNTEPLSFSQKLPTVLTPQVESRDTFPWVLQHAPVAIPAPKPTGFH